MHPDIVCERCFSGIVEHGEPTGSTHYVTSTGLDFYGCPHLAFVEQEQKRE